MDELISPKGSLSIAISALLLVLGFRFARPERGLEWAAFLAYAAALGVQVLGSFGLLAGGAMTPGSPVRIAGALLLVVGLVTAGGTDRARRRPAGATSSALPRSPGDMRKPAYAGLALVLIGQLLRGPSAAGAIAVGVAALLLGWAAFTSGASPRRA